MILILSEEKDLSTTQVIEWLNFLNKKWIRINVEDIIKIECLDNDFVLSTKNLFFKFSDINSFWYRRGFFNIKFEEIEIKEISNFIKQEAKVLIEYLYFKLKTIHHLDSINNFSVNKLIVNSIAKEYGLIIPESYLFSKKNDLLKILNEIGKPHITKTIADGSFIHFEHTLFFSYTSLINIDDIKSELFFPSLIQKCIDKKYELRIFYLNGEFFSMAILSQNDEQTSIDFRRYNDLKPNRRVPYKLPLDIEIRLAKLMKKFDFNSGSIDMIVTTNMEYIFLEINPVGQFSMTSYPCNYNVEKKIAEYL